MFSFSKILILIFIVVGIVAGLAYGCPQYHVYVQKKDGEAQLAHAQYAKEVAVAEARAKMESAPMLAEADTTRARGIARSNEIIGASLKQNPGYLTWLWIDQISKNQNEIIYVPTEANIPIMEANRFINKRGLTDSTK